MKAAWEPTYDPIDLNDMNLKREEVQTQNLRVEISHCEHSYHSVVSKSDNNIIA